MLLYQAASLAFVAMCAAASLTWGKGIPWSRDSRTNSESRSLARRDQPWDQDIRKSGSQHSHFAPWAASAPLGLAVPVRVDQSGLPDAAQRRTYQDQKWGSSFNIKRHRILDMIVSFHNAISTKQGLTHELQSPSALYESPAEQSERSASDSSYQDADVRTTFIPQRQQRQSLACPRGTGGHRGFLCPLSAAMGHRHCVEDRQLCDGRLDCPHREDEQPVMCLFYQAIRFQLNHMMIPNGKRMYYRKKRHISAANSSTGDTEDEFSDM